MLVDDRFQITHAARPYSFEVKLLIARVVMLLVCYKVSKLVVDGRKKVTVKDGVTETGMYTLEPRGALRSYVFVCFVLSSSIIAFKVLMPVVARCRQRGGPRDHARGTHYVHAAGRHPSVISRPSLTL